jgi:hypothetical protein
MYYWLIALAWSVSPTSVADVPPEQVFADGMEAWRNGRADEALASFRAVAPDHARWPLAALLRVRSLRAAGEIRPAAQLCGDILGWKGAHDDTTPLVKDLALIELASLYKAVNPSRAPDYYRSMPRASPLRGLADARRAELLAGTPEGRNAGLALARLPPKSIVFPEILAIRAELLPAGCKRTSKLPKPLRGVAAELTEQRARVAAVRHPDALADRPDIVVPADLQQLFIAADATPTPELEVEAEQWLRVQVQLELARVDRALARIEAATAACLRE